MKPVILDTNIFIRFLVKDHQEHFQKSKIIFEEIENGKTEAFASILVINEMVWVLENYYELKRSAYITQILKLLALKNLKIMEVQKLLITNVLHQMLIAKFDFTDTYLAHISGPNQIVSFDKDFQKIK